MILNLIKRLNQRTKNIIGTIFDILIKTVIASLLMCFVFAAIGKFANLSFMTSLGGFCFLIFFITICVLITIGIFILISFIIDAIRRDGIKKLIKSHFKTFTISFAFLIVIHFIKYKNLEWVKSFLYSLLITLSLFFKTEASMSSKEIEQEYSLNVPSDESHNK